MNHQTITPQLAAARERLQGPTGSAVGIPGNWYWSEQFARLESERLFARTWMCVGYAHELPEPGDCVPVDVAGFPIILTRNSGGQIQAYHNSCPHRGMRLLNQPLKGDPVIKCPYHAWAFDMDGRLKSTPHWGGYQNHSLEGFDTSCHGLKPIRCEQWYDWLFVNIDGEAPPFSDYSKSFRSHLAEYDFDALVHVKCVPYQLNGNWKIVQENFLEVLHLPPIHGRLSEYAPFQDHDLIVDDHCVGTVIEAGLPASWAEHPLPRHPGTASDAQNAKNLCLFPTFKLVTGPDHCCSMIEFPEAPGLTRQRWDFFFVGEDSIQPIYETAHREIIDFFCDTKDEDAGAIEGLHRGRRSPGYEGGVLSEVWEGAVRQLQCLVLRYISENNENSKIKEN